MLDEVRVSKEMIVDKSAWASAEILHQSLDLSRQASDLRATAQSWQETIDKRKQHAVQRRQIAGSITIDEADVMKVVQQTELEALALERQYAPRIAAIIKIAESLEKEANKLAQLSRALLVSTPLSGNSLRKAILVLGGQPT